MKKSRALLYPALLPVALALLAPPAQAAVETKVMKSFALDGTPLVVENTYDGQTIFVLTDKGEVLIYGIDGILKDRIKLEEPADGMVVAPTGNALLLTNRARKTVRFLSIDFIKVIDTAGAPSKGPADAPVTIALFSDFQ
jgi:DNA-binding beta-propeller fold protein YncE